MGQKALFLRNRGSALDVDLVVEQILEQDNPATREQGTDRPGQSTASPAVARSAMEQVDWHTGPASQSVPRRGRHPHRR
jgi:hypothetical protein